MNLPTICRLCHIPESNSKELVSPVSGIGPSECTVFFIGQNPGEAENLVGKPFIGPAGQRLDMVIADAGLRRERCYLTNCVKCKTDRNLVPGTESIKICSREYLLRELMTVRYELIVPLGRIALRALRFLVDSFPCMIQPKSIFPMTHPSAALRDALQDARLIRETEKLKSIMRSAYE